MGMSDPVKLKEGMTVGAARTHTHTGHRDRRTDAQTHRRTDAHAHMGATPHTE